MASMQKAYAGLVADQQTSVRLSRLAEDFIHPGRVITQGSMDNKAIQGGTGPVIGIAMADRTLSPEQDGIYHYGNTVGYVSHPAIIWCAAQVAVTAGAPAAYDPATGEINLAGTPIPNAIFDSSGAAGELVKLRLQ